MPFSGPNVPNLLSATAIDQRIAAQYGQNSAPMYKNSGLPCELVSVVSLIDRIGRPVVGRAPVPTLARVLAGTVVSPAKTGFDSLAPPCCFWPVRLLMTTKATTITMTRNVEPA